MVCRSPSQADWADHPPDHPALGAELPAEVKIACFRVAQEAMTNVSRHARAKQMWIKLFQSEEEVRLDIRDDGIGFDLAVARQRAMRGRSIGILGMRERVELIGGLLSWSRPQERGPPFGSDSTLRFGQRRWEFRGVNFLNCLNNLCYVKIVLEIR